MPRKKEENKNGLQKTMAPKQPRALKCKRVGLSIRLQKSGPRLDRGLHLPEMSPSKWESELFGWLPNSMEIHAGLPYWSPYAYLSVYRVCPKMLLDKRCDGGFGRTTQQADVPLQRDLGAVSQAMLWKHSRLSALRQRGTFIFNNL